MGELNFRCKKERKRLLGWRFHVPEAIRELDIDFLELKLRPAVYFLCLKGRIIYVGSTSNIAQRIARHREDRRVFDSAIYFHCLNIAGARSAEKEFIKSLKPDFNKTLKR